MLLGGFWGLWGRFLIFHKLENPRVNCPWVFCVCCWLLFVCIYYFLLETTTIPPTSRTTAAAPMEKEKEQQAKTVAISELVRNMNVSYDDLKNAVNIAKTTTIGRPVFLGGCRRG